MTGIGTHIALYTAKAYAPVRPAFILPDVKDESKWFNDKHHFLYSQEGHAFVFEGSVTNWISFNTSLAKPDDFKSWSDLLNPKWKGKIVSYDSTIPGTGAPALKQLLFL